MIFTNYLNISHVNIPDKVILQNDMTNIFANMKNLYLVNIANSVIDNATNMAYAFFNCNKLNTQPFSGSKVTNMAYAYRLCSNIKYSPACGENVIDMTRAYSGCHNLIGSPVSGSNVVNMADTYVSCVNLNGQATCGEKVVDMSNTYSGCYKLAGPPACGNNVVNMHSTYWYCNNIKGAPVCGPNVINMCNSYQNCSALTGQAACGEKVVDMSNAYWGCSSLVTPICGNNVTNMASTYHRCFSLGATPVCGPNVVNMDGTYAYCNNLRSIPICGEKVTIFSYTYKNCSNLIGPPVCGDNVTTMSCTYQNCKKLTGAPVCGPKVTAMGRTYDNCPNVCGNMYMHSPNVSSMGHCFYNRNTSNMLNIYVPSNSISLSTLLISTESEWTSADPITGNNCSWTNDTANSRYYNTKYNIYIYPVTNIQEARINNGEYGLKITNIPKTEFETGETIDLTGTELILYPEGANIKLLTLDECEYEIDENELCTIRYIYKDKEYTTTVQLTRVYHYPPLADFDYIDNEDGTYTITNWRQTLNRESSTELITPDDESVIL